MSAWSQRLVASPGFGRVIFAAIAGAAVLLGLETFPTLVATHGTLFRILDGLILAIFAVEAALKIAAHGRRPLRYFADGWNVFDFTILVVCLLPLGDTHFAAVLRLARVLRMLRLVTAVPRLQLLVIALLRSLPSMTWVGLLLFLHFYMYAVIGVFLFGSTDPAGFGHLGRAFLTLFKVVTLEGWVDIMDGVSHGRAASAPAYFISFIVLGTMIMLNLFIGVITSGMASAEAEQERLAARAAAARGDPGSPASPATALAAVRAQAAELQRRIDALEATLPAESPRKGPLN